MISASLAALTAINEAISALDLDSVDLVETDELTNEAVSILLEARAMLTNKPWPEMPAVDAAKREAWITARAAEQILDGRQ